MNADKHHQIDRAHHHPHVRRTGRGAWTWTCDCGSAACRVAMATATWRQTVIGALNHAALLAP